MTENEWTSNKHVSKSNLLSNLDKLCLSWLTHEDAVGLILAISRKYHTDKA